MNGFHCAGNPLDCLNYYNNWDNAVFYLVLVDGDTDEDEIDSKIACTRIKLVKQLDKEEFIAHSLNYLYQHPLLKMNRRVSRERGQAVSGFAIVRGKYPIAKGSLGDILGFAQEESENNRIEHLSMYIVDGVDIRPDVWYDADGHSVKMEAA